MSKAGRKQRYENSIRTGNLVYAKLMNDAPEPEKKEEEVITEAVVIEKEKEKVKKTKE